MELSRSARFEIARRLLAAVADHLIVEYLTLVERSQASALDRGDMDEHVSTAVLRRNESIAFRRIEPFHCASSCTVPVAIMASFACTNVIAAARGSCDHSSEISIAYGKTPKGARQTRPSSNIGSVRGSRKGFNRAMGFRIKGSTPVPVGNLCSEILVMQPAQNWDRQRATDSLDATWDPACPCAAIGACEPHCNIFGRN